MNTKIKISIVSYTNTLPFKWALRRSSLLDKIELHEDIPSICAQKLKFRQVDLALVPVALLNELEEYYIVSDYCIGANGLVDSVKLYSNVSIEDVDLIRLDYQSRSSVALTKVLCKHHWKINPEFIDAKPGFENEIVDRKANVVIGDRTFALNGKFKHEYDLAQEWKNMTGLPFVFAAWVSYRQLDSEFVSSFNEVLAKGVANIEQAVQDKKDSLQIPENEVLHYLKNRISYQLDDDKLKAMKLFLGYLSQF